MNLIPRYRRSLSVVMLSLLILQQPGLGAVVPFDGRTGLVVLDVVINGSVTGRFGLDTGADRLYLDRTFAIQHDLLRDAVPARGQAVSVEGRAGTQVIALRSLEIGDDPMLPNVRATLLDIGSLTAERSEAKPDGLLGYDFLRQFYVTVDYPAGKVELRSDAPRYLDGRAYHAVPFRLQGHLIVVDATINGGVSCRMIVDY